MKTNAIIRIILFTLAILVLLGILFAGLGLSLYRTSFGQGKTSNEAGPLAVDGDTVRGAVDAKAVKGIKIAWVTGNITIQPDETATDITFYETGNDREKYQMVYTTRGNTLEIEYCKDAITFPSFGLNPGDLSKDLTITVPADWICVDLELDVAAANVLVRDLTIQEVDFDGASGTCTFQSCAVTEMELDAASGDIHFSGKLQTLDFDAASANFIGVLANVPRLIEVDSASGDLDLTLPADAGFTVTIDGMSSDFTSDFPTLPKNSGYVAGDGACMIDVDGMSCDVTIRMAE